MAPISAYDTHADIGMQPWEHFIPTRLDFEDVEEKAAWCFSHDRECEAIGAAGRAHMLRLFATYHGKVVLSRYERQVDELILSHLIANARNCSEGALSGSAL